MSSRSSPIGHFFSSESKDWGNSGEEKLAFQKAETSTGSGFSIKHRRSSAGTREKRIQVPDFLFAVKFSIFFNVCSSVFGVTADQSCVNREDNPSLLTFYAILLLLNWHSDMLQKWEEGVIVKILLIGVKGSQHKTKGLRFYMNLHLI